MSNVLHETAPRKLHQTLIMIYPFYYISMAEMFLLHNITYKSSQFFAFGFFFLDVLARFISQYELISQVKIKYLINKKI